MEQYIFLAVAPCTFMLDSKSYNLTAGQTISVNESTASKITSSGFQYRNFLSLVYKSELHSNPVANDPLVEATPSVAESTTTEPVTNVTIKEEPAPVQSSSKRTSTKVTETSNKKSSEVK